MMALLLKWQGLQLCGQSQKIGNAYAYSACMARRCLLQLGMDKKEAIKQASQRLGGNYASLARALGLEPPTIAGWISGKRPVPLQQAVEIEKRTGMGVRAEYLSPDYADVIYYLRASGRKRKKGGQ